jgi:hypothetical protein
MMWSRYFHLMTRDHPEDQRAFAAASQVRLGRTPHPSATMSKTEPARTGPTREHKTNDLSSVKVQRSERLSTQRPATTPIDRRAVL